MKITTLIKNTVVITLGAATFTSAQAQTQTYVNPSDNYMHDKTVKWSEISNDKRQASEAWLQDLENQYSKEYIQKLLDYLLNKNIITSENNRVTNLDVFE